MKAKTIQNNRNIKTNNKKKLLMKRYEQKKLKRMKNMQKKMKMGKNENNCFEEQFPFLFYGFESMN